MHDNFEFQAVAEIWITLDSTPREHEVLNQVVSGRLNKEIGSLKNLIAVALAVVAYRYPHPLKPKIREQAELSMKKEKELSIM